MNHSEELREKFENIALEANRPGSYDAMILGERIKTLMKANTAPTEKAHEIFADVCRHGIDALKDYQGHLTDSPAAPLLLEYLQLACKRYLSSVDNSKIKPNTADRRAYLASAFGVVGNSGSAITERQKNAICVAYSGALY